MPFAPAAAHDDHDDRLTSGARTTPGERPVDAPGHRFAFPGQSRPVPVLVDPIVVEDVFDDELEVETVDRTVLDGMRAGRDGDVLDEVVDGTAPVPPVEGDDFESFGDEAADAADADDEIEDEAADVPIDDEPAAEERVADESAAVDEADGVVPAHDGDELPADADHEVAAWTLAADGTATAPDETGERPGGDADAEAEAPTFVVDGAAVVDTADAETSYPVTADPVTADPVTADPVTADEATADAATAGPETTDRVDADERTDGADALDDDEPRAHGAPDDEARTDEGAAPAPLPTWAAGAAAGAATTAPETDRPVMPEPGTIDPATAPVAAGRNSLRLGAATAAGLSTMTPVTRVTEAPHRELGGTVLKLTELSKRFGDEYAVEDVSVDVRQGSFYGIVGPNGAGKTTTLSMATGLLKPTSGTVEVLGIDVWADPAEARARIGILPDRLRLFDQLTGAQLLYYTGVLRGLGDDEARARTESLVRAFELGTAANRLVVDYSAGMTKKVALASALIHSPELLVLDEPFESIDPVSAVQLTDILFDYVGRGGTVILSSHSMDLVQRVCDHVAIIVKGEILADGTVDSVRGDITLEERFRDIVRGPQRTEGLDWLGISFN